jgi:hypothetical protein
MPDYRRGKIYKIIPTNTDEDICYVGSTTLPLLSQRMAEHRNIYKYLKAGGKVSNISSYTLFDRYNVENCSIELIETFPCDTKDELTKREGYYIRSLNCVNKVIPGRTKQEWYEANPEYQRKWFEANPEYQRKWYEANPNCNKEYQRKWYEANKSIIAEKRKKEYTCICGSTLQKSNKSQHERSHKHINYCASVSVVL